MKIILSRKGFDHERGGHPSPILPEGGMISLPILGEGGEHSRWRYDDLYFSRDGKIADLMESLGINGFREEAVHLDPDLRRSTLRERGEGWKPLFGQVGAAQSHLHRKGVGIGDLFLFFGWFKKTKRENGKIVFDNLNDPVGKHVIFGYLQIGQILHAGDYLEKWMEYHPHAYFIRYPSWEKDNNTMYVANQTLSFRQGLNGGGNFIYNEKSANLLTLTKSGTRNISEWNLPPEVFENADITYHRVKEKVWKRDSRGLYFQSAKTHWQESVITDEAGKVRKWAENLIFQLDESGCIE